MTYDENRHSMLTRALENRSALMGLIVAMVRDTDVAEDLFQNTMVAVAESDRTFDSDKEFLAWSWGVARNMVLRHWASLKRNPQSVDPAVLEATAGAIMEDDDTDVWHQEKKHLKHCLKKLPPRNRELFMLRYAGNLKGPALAEELQIKVGSLRTTLLRIRSALRRCITARVQATAEGGRE